MPDRVEQRFLRTYGECLDELDWGLFVLGSSDRRGRRHAINATYVPRVGPAILEPAWSWETIICPATIAQAATLRAEAFILDAIITHYGIQEDLPF